MKIRILDTNLSMVVPSSKRDCQERRPYCLIVCGDTKYVAKVLLDPVALQPSHSLFEEEISIVLETVKYYEHWFIDEYFFQGMDKNIRSQ